MTRFNLIYHSGIPGRAEFIRLYFEATGTKYFDSALDDPNMMPLFLNEGFPGSESNPTPFASPILQDTETGLVLHQTSNILLYLSTLLPRIDLDANSSSTDDKVSKLSKNEINSLEYFHANEILLTILDFVNECHDCHHPLSSAAYYEEQKETALMKTEAFKSLRIRRFFDYFERNLKKGSENGFFFKSGASFVDLALFQVIAGMKFAFPKTMEKIQVDYPRMQNLFNLINSSPKIQSYLASDRRQPFGQGIFRYYTELDEKL